MSIIQQSQSAWVDESSYSGIVQADTLVSPALHFWDMHETGGSIPLITDVVVGATITSDSIAAGAAAGAVNGFIITRGHVPAFIVTLGMLGIARGLALIISSGRGIYGLPEEILFLGQARPWGIPTPVFILLMVAMVSHYILAHTPFGHHTLALGDNENSARATGINVRRQRMMLYTIAGLMAGIGGGIFTARVNTGDPTAGLNYELLAITAAIIGGTNLFGGRGSILGTMIGALIMGVLQNGLNLMAVQAYYQQMAIGAVLIAAVWLDQIRTRGRSLQ